ncbi:MAG: hypothetical protein KC442_21065, partial [Thermomicrobiales bacterium]|nr:hypothetical protein [Thermomicrobiales bacterium]
MASAHDASLGDVQLTIVPGSYRRRNKESGRAGVTERLVINRFGGQRNATQGDGDLADRSWDGVSVGPVWDGAGVEPWPHTAPYGDAMTDVPSTTVRAHCATAANAVFIGIGRRIYKTVALTTGTWSALTVAADLGAGYVISGLAYYQDDLL